LPIAITLLGAMLGGCSMSPDSFSAANLNPFRGSDPFRASDYNYFYKSEVAKSGPLTAADLIGPDGRCAFAPPPVQEAMPGPAAPPPGAPPPGAPPYAAAPPVAAAPPGAPPPAEPVAAAPPTDPINPGSNRALYFTAGPQAGPVTGAQPGAVPPEVRNGPRGISLAMSECQVVAVAGYTDRVEIGANERGERTVTLTYLTGERPGIYRFRAGRLMSMDRVAEPPAPPKPKKPVKTAKLAKKKKQPPPPQQQ
jgi:hypothetical protein